MTKKKIIISGGGTGGHIFPAISIANALKKIDKEIEILFVGAIGKIEMEKVPAAGYKIIGLPIRGINRKLSLANLSVPFLLLKSIAKAKQIIKTFNPNVVVGVGGYASGPMLWVANRQKIHTILQEQNSFAGVTNKILGKKAKKICVAYDNMQKFFPSNKIILTGNPVREEIQNMSTTRKASFEYFNIPENQKVILIIGGSLGARTLNKSVIENINFIKENPGITVILQTGRYYYEWTKEEIENQRVSNILVFPFIERMDMAYASANIIVSRAGAGTISELCIIGKPVIFVPSPNVAEDHQTKNALSLVNKNAALMVKDSEAPALLIKEAFNLAQNEEKLKLLSKEIKKLAMNDSARKIAEIILALK